MAPPRAVPPEMARTLNQARLEDSGTGPSRSAATPAGYSASALNSTNGSLFSVTFFEVGLATGTFWSVTARGNTTNSTTSSIVILSPHGNYSFSVKIPAGYRGPTQGIFELTDMNTTVSLTYYPLVHLTFEEVGLVPGWNWSVILNGNGTNFTNETRTSVDATIVFQEIPGVHNFTTVASTFTALPSVGKASIGTLPSTVTITFVPFPGAVHLAVSPSAAQVWIDGRLITLSAGRFSANETPGLYSVEALAPGYAPYFNNISLTRGNETNLTISLASLGGSSGSGLGTSISPLALAVTVGLLILVVLLLIGVAYYRGQVARLHPSDELSAGSAETRSQQPPTRVP